MFNHIDHDYQFQKIDKHNTAIGRFYTTPDRKEYPSITNVLSLLSKDSIDAWKERVGEEEAKRISSVSTQRGTRIHLMAEHYINNDENWKSFGFSLDLPLFYALKKVLDSSVDDVIAQEAPLYSDKLKMAGTVDLIAKYNKKLSIIDFKTSMKPKKEEWVKSYKLQCSFYAMAFYERFGVMIDDFHILIAVDDMTTQVFSGKVGDYIKEVFEVRKLFKKTYGY